MSATRRVVTGHAANGHSIIASDGLVDGLPVPGMESVSLGTLWGADTPLHYPDAGAEPVHHTFFPPLHGMRFVTFELAPDAAAATADDNEDTAARMEANFPGMLAHFDAADPGMHRTATTDMLYVAAGRCVLELDDGSATELHAGDVLVQSGTMHRWTNPFDEICRIVGFVVGATHDNC